MIRLSAIALLLGLATSTSAQVDYASLPVLERDPDYPGWGAPFNSLFDLHESLRAPDGSVYVLSANRLSASHVQGALGRFEPGGAPDGAFGADAAVWFAVTPELDDASSRLISGALHPDGSVVVVGEVDPDNATSPEYTFVARVTPGGVLDTGFGTEGVVTFPDLRPTNGVLSVSALDDGRSLVFAGDQRLWFSATGTVDSTQAGGARTHPTVLPDGSLLFVSTSTATSGAQRLQRTTPSGQFDPSFGTDGFVDLPDIEVPRGRAARLVFDASGRIYVYGTRTVAFGNAALAVARFTADFELDTSFGTEGVYSLDLNPFDDVVHAVSPFPDGRILISGRTEVNNRDTDIPFVLLSEAGVPDASFGANGIAVYRRNRFSEGDEWLAALGLYATPEGVIVVFRRSDPTGSGFSARVGRPDALRIALNTGAVATDASPTPLQLDSPAPNPARGSVRLRATLAEAAPVRVAVYDALGREVATLLDGRQPAGALELAVDTVALAPGAYHVRWTVEERVATQLLTVVR